MFVENNVHNIIINKLKTIKMTEIILKIKKKMKDRYDLSVRVADKFRQPIVTLTNLYNQKVAEIDDEYYRYKNKKNPYDMFTDINIMNIMLEKNLNNVNTYFIKVTNSIVNISSIILEDELSIAKQLENDKISKLENKRIMEMHKLNNQSGDDLRNDNIVFATSGGDRELANILNKMRS